MVTPSQAQTVVKNKEELKPADKSFYVFNNMEANGKLKEDNTGDIHMGKAIKQDVRKRLDFAHRDMADVFDESLQRLLRAPRVQAQLGR